MSQPALVHSSAIVTDASADVPEVEREAAAGEAGLRWEVVPEVWRGGGLEVPDFGEPNRELVRLVLGSTRMEVAEPGFDDFVRTYERVRDVGCVWSIHPSAQVSGAVAAARDAAGGFPNVRVVECAAAGIGVGLLAARIAALTAEGHDPDGIGRYVRRQASAVRFLVVPDRFDPAGGQRMLTATLLAGRPLLSARDGTMARSRRLRSRKATVGAIERYLADHAPADRTVRLAIGHGDAAGAVDPFLDIVERVRPNASIELVGRIGPRLVGQLGVRCVGLALVVE